MPNPPPTLAGRWFAGGSIPQETASWARALTVEVEGDVVRGTARDTRSGWDPERGHVVDADETFSFEGARVDGTVAVTINGRRAVLSIRDGRLVVDGSRFDGLYRPG